MLNKDKHSQILYKILVDIFNSDLSKNLAFKWWTACYFLYSLDRFSTDLDFDLIQESNYLDEKLINILKKYGEIKKNNKIILSYGKEDDNIKIDINRNIWENNKYEIVNFFWTDIKVQTKDTIFANKLVALTERTTNRDIYDIYFFMQNLWDINTTLIKERTSKNEEEIFKIILDKLNNLWSNYKILDWLWEVLNIKQKTFVKEKLLNELKWMIQFKINFTS